jgi:4-hydroxyphenylpyruvate dioxygenase
MNRTTHSTASAANPLALDGLEFVEYSTADPDAFGALLERMGFVRVARHRSRRVFLYRQGSINLIVDADPEVLRATTSKPNQVVLSALAFRVADAGYAYRTLLDKGAWPIPTRAEAMELNIPGVHGVGDSILYLVDRHLDFSIYDVDFEYVRDIDRYPPATAGLQLFGVTQVVGAGRMDEWFAFYNQLFGFVLDVGAAEQAKGDGVLLRSPCAGMRLRLVELPDDLSRDEHWDESFGCLLLGAPDVVAAERVLRERGVMWAEGHGGGGPRTRDDGDGTQFELIATPAVPTP